MSERAKVLLVLFGPGILAVLVLTLVCLFSRRLEQIIFPLILFGPGGLGVLILAFACFLTNRLRWLVVACGISLILLLVSCALTCAVMGLSWGNNDALKLPWKVFLYGIIAIATLSFAKIMHIVCLGCRSNNGGKEHSIQRKNE